MQLPYLAAALCSLIACSAYAQQAPQTVLRCTKDGKVSYTDQPCPQGAQSAELAVAPAPAPDAASAADLARQAALAEKMRQQREQRSAQEEREDQRATHAARLQRQKCQRLQLAQRWAAEDAGRAPVAQREAAQLKARRAGQSLALECPDK
ncbi:DUF4124 domain-containing protein [Duganella qianjiadongensis]|uniref:DUF4124 domain-containing protein n=1 Tax=Duganella qianjiadongensis TaxID=2692176 RepID=A0ABW9VQ53_9BURK|nr:DUF4124 domain-containing protein [Duganella qianjiadongensis]MYM39827.1 DUF4124 domain-containing protein [Duganella qianjiadongensis]